MFAFTRGEKYPLIFGFKWATLRPISHKNQGGENQVLMCERVKGGFATADISHPIEINLLDFMHPRARALGVDLILARALGYISLEKYLEQPYNKSNGSPLRKMYFISNIRPNWGQILGENLTKLFDKMGVEL